MKEYLASARHLVRMAGLFAAGVLAFVALRFLLVPKGFGVLGHYRSGALADVAARPPVFGGQVACADCHTETVDVQKGSKHAGVSCEACHGPLGKHAGDPSVQAPEKLTATLCVACHAQNVAKPKGFPQIDPKTHGEGAACTECHGAHAPEKGPA